MIKLTRYYLPRVVKHVLAVSEKDCPKSFKLAKIWVTNLIVALVLIRIPHIISSVLCYRQKKRLQWGGTLQRNWLTNMRWKEKEGIFWLAPWTIFSETRPLNKIQKWLDCHLGWAHDWQGGPCWSFRCPALPWSCTTQSCAQLQSPWKITMLVELLVNWWKQAKCLHSFRFSHSRFTFSRSHHFWGSRQVGHRALPGWPPPLACSRQGLDCQVGT